jgi:5'-nucleotidase
MMRGLLATLARVTRALMLGPTPASKMAAPMRGPTQACVMEALAVVVAAVAAAAAAVLAAAAPAAEATTNRPGAAAPASSHSFRCCWASGCGAGVAWGDEPRRVWLSARPRMMHSHLGRHLVGVALVVLVLSGCQTAPQPRAAVGPAPAAVAAPLHLTLVGTNDVHGWVMAQKEPFPTGEIRYGGAATFAAYLRVLRDENPTGVVLVDAGDLFQGTLMSNLTEGSVVIDAFNLLGYDAAAVGNHEFDYGPVGPVSAATQPTMDPFGALKARIAQAKFPLLSVNIYESASGLRPEWLKGDGSVIVERNGVKVGIFGLTTPQTPTVTLPINVATLRFGSLAPEALNAARRLRDRGADLVIATVHAGGKCGEVSHAHDLSSCDLDTGEAFEMLRGLPEGTLDAVVAGHTHAQIGHFVGTTPVIESWALGRSFGTIDLFLDPKTKKVLKEQTHIESGIALCETVDQATGSCDPKKLKPSGNKAVAAVQPVPAQFHGHVITPDAAVLAAIKPAEQQVSALQLRPLGVNVPAALVRRYEDESALGSLLADALRAMSKADVSLLNPGGLRADLRDGPLTYGEVYEVLPFDNQIATLDLTGDQLRHLLLAAFGGRKGVFQFSGLEVKLGRCPSPDRLKSFSLPGGKAVDPLARYRVVMPDFLARGGDGLGPALAGIERERVDLGDNRGTNLRDELVTWFQDRKQPLVAPKPGRVVFLDGGGNCSPGTKIDPQSGGP